MVAAGAAFFISMASATAVCATFWQFGIADVLYNCTDSVPPEYFRPGNWVHDSGAGPVRTVDRIVPRSIIEPDTIRRGWTPFRLTLLWLGFFSASVAVSVAAARLAWKLPED